MRVWDYTEKQWDELGRVRWEIEWITAKPSALKKGEDIDPDFDTITHVKFREDEASALQRAGIAGQTEIGIGSTSADLNAPY